MDNDDEPPAEWVHVTHAFFPKQLPLTSEELAVLRTRPTLPQSLSSMHGEAEPGWELVVDEWREALVRTRAWRRERPYPGSGEVIPTPATREDIAAAEARLGVALPAPLLALYALADGLPTIGGDVYGVRGCAELGWFRDAEADVVEAWEDVDAEALRPHLDLMRAGLAVTKDGDEYRLLFVGDQAAQSTEQREWVLYRQSNGGDGVTPQPSLPGNLLSMLRLCCGSSPDEPNSRQH